MKISQRYPQFSRSLKRWLPVALIAAVPTAIFSFGQANPGNYSESTGIPGAIASSDAQRDGNGLTLSQDRLSTEGSRLDTLLPRRKDHQLSFSAGPHADMPRDLLGDLARRLPPLEADQSGTNHSFPGLRMVSMRWRIYQALDCSSSSSTGTVPRMQSNLVDMPGQLGYYPALPTHDPGGILASDRSPVVHLDGLKYSRPLSALLKPTYQFDGKIGEPSATAGPSSSHWMILTVVQFGLSHADDDFVDPSTLSGQNLCLDPQPKTWEASEPVETPGQPPL